MVHKGCQRCHGDLYEEEFPDSVDLVCLQCGYRQEVKQATGEREGLKSSRWFQARPSKAA